jgi:hypothetical protein
MGQGAAMIFGKDATLDQFNDYELDLWAVYQGKMRVRKGDGADDLAGFLDKLGNTPSGALYTLRVYDTGDLNSINDKTEAAGAFNFKLYSAMMSGYGGGANEQLHARLAAIESKLDAGGQASGKKSFGDVIMGWMETPEDLVTVIGAFKMLTGGGTPPAIAGFKVTQTDTEPVQEVRQTEEQLNRLESAIDKLEKADPRMVDHLERLAKLAESEPGKFAFLVKALDAGL